MATFKGPFRLFRGFLRQQFKSESNDSSSSDTNHASAEVKARQALSAPVQGLTIASRPMPAETSQSSHAISFSHQSPTYCSPFDMMKTCGVSYRSAGENIAGNGSVSGAHTSLMNSSGHRANILSSRFTHVGIGIIKGGRYGMMFTQMSISK